MAWIKIEHTMPDKPEVARMAEALGIDHDAVIGKLIRFWIWLDNQSVNGNDLSVTSSLLNRITSCANFAEALENVGWLRGENGTFSVPHFERHNGNTAKSRALSGKRMKRFRNAKVTRKTSRLSSLVFSSLELYLSSELVPEILRTKEFYDLWLRWEKHRDEMKKPLHKTQVSSQLKMLGKLGVERATAMVEHTITMGWQGLRESDNGKPGSSSTGKPSHVGPGQRYRPPEAT